MLSYFKSDSAIIVAIQDLQPTSQDGKVSVSDFVVLVKGLQAMSLASRTLFAAERKTDLKRATKEVSVAHLRRENVFIVNSTVDEKMQQLIDTMNDDEKQRLQDFDKIAAYMQLLVPQGIYAK